MSDILDAILARKREEVAQRSRARPLDDLRAIASGQPPTRSFAAALQRRLDAGEAAVNAEIKKASPSKGVIRSDFQPAQIARSYAAGGAACLSVLTDIDFFQGNDAYLAEARGACALPVLRKDFVIDPWQVAESRALGADAILVIMAAVDDELALDLVDAANDFGMDVLVECHDAEEVERALTLDARLIGINNRSLRTFETKLETTEQLAPRVPAGRIVVAESGIFDPIDIARLARAGAHAYLVGESLMRQADVAAATRALLKG